MSKISLIIKREYLTRVKKKSFVIMTLIGPLLMAGLMIVPVWLSQVEEKTQKILVVDETTVIGKTISNTEKLYFDVGNITLEEAKSSLHSSDYSAILYIPISVFNNPTGVMMFYKQQPGITTQRYIEKAIEKEIEDSKLAASGIDKTILKSIQTNVKIATINLPESGVEEKSSTEASMVIGLFAGILIYMFIFLYGVQVMRGVIEEKTNRIIEVIISSVKPFQLMLGKIIGVALVGLTQFILWIILTFTLVSTVQALFVGKMASQRPNVATTLMEAEGEKMKDINQAQDMNNIVESLGLINFPLMLGAFLFYFLGGYLLYSALFAAVGAAVDSESDTQQFMLPITIPLIFSFIMAQFIINNPEGSIAFWFSIIPFTSPVIMMVRIPFGVPYFDLVLSVIFLILGFLGTTWIAARVYRTGILMYGKKTNYRELWKWLFYKH